MEETKRPRSLLGTRPLKRLGGLPVWELEAAGYLLRRGRRGQKQAKRCEFMRKSCLPPLRTVKAGLPGRPIGPRRGTQSVGRRICPIGYAPTYMGGLGTA